MPTSSHPFFRLSQEEQIEPVAEAISWAQRRSSEHRKKVYGDAKNYEAVVMLGAVNSMQTIRPHVPKRVKLAKTDAEYLVGTLVPTFLQYNMTRDRSVFFFNEWLRQSGTFNPPGLVNKLGDWCDTITQVVAEIREKGKRSILFNFDAQATPKVLVPAILNTLQAILAYDIRPAKLLVNSLVKGRFKDPTVDPVELYRREILPLFPEFELCAGFKESSDISHRTEMEYVYFIRKEAA